MSLGFKRLTSNVKTLLLFETSGGTSEEYGIVCQKTEYSTKPT